MTGKEYFCCREFRCWYNAVL